MAATDGDELDQAFALISEGDLASASIVTNRVLENDPNNPYGLLAWGRILLASGNVDGAVDAHEAAVRFAPIDARVHFALADSLRSRAENESPFFRAPTWSRARLAAEQGVYLAPDDEQGRLLLLDILERQLADVDDTRDSTPMDMLGQQGRGPIEEGLGRWLWWLGPVLIVALWLIWSWISPAFTWVDLVVIATILFATLLGFRTWLGPRIDERRGTVEF